MMKLVLVLLAVFVSVPALAYREGTYACKNSDITLPDNTYKFETVNIGGVSLPVLEIKRYSRADSGNVNSPIQQIGIKGLALVVTSANGIETISVNNIRLEFKGDEFLNCKK